MNKGNSCARKILSASSLKKNPDLEEIVSKIPLHIMTSSTFTFTSKEYINFLLEGRRFSFCHHNIKLLVILKAIFLSKPKEKIFCISTTEDIVNFMGICKGSLGNSKLGARGHF